MIVALIPAYNAKHTIAEVIFKTKKIIKNPLNIIVYDDGSTDETAFIAESCGVFVVRSEVNKGKGHALKVLFELAKARYERLKDRAVFVTLDADMQHDPYDMPRLIEPILNNEADIVFGVRRPKDIPTWRRWGNQILDFLTRRKHKETQCGFRAYNWKALNEIEIKSKGFSVNGEIYDQAVGKLRCAYVEVGVKYDEFSHTKSPIAHFLEVVNFLFLRKPLRNLGLLGSAGFIIGILEIGEVIRRWNLYHELALGTFLTGMLFVILGAFTFYTGLILHVLMERSKD